MCQVTHPRDTCATFSPPCGEEFFRGKKKKKKKARRGSPVRIVLFLFLFFLRELGIGSTDAVSVSRNFK
eukprot:4958429-Prymnesium_polylepis.1